jgi:hypothetical protein
VTAAKRPGEGVGNPFWWVAARTALSCDRPNRVFGTDSGDLYKGTKATNVPQYGGEVFLASNQRNAIATPPNLGSMLDPISFSGLISTPFRIILPFHNS